MRENTRSITSSPEFSVIRGADSGNWGLLKFSNPAACLQFSKAHGHTQNEVAWSENSDWIGLENQPFSNFMASGIAEHSKSLVLSESRKLSDAPSRPGEFKPAITGGFWDVPSVIAGLPLAARTRVRNKLPPKTLKVCLSMSAIVKAGDIAKITARIAHALWQYTIAGGAVTLDIAFAGEIRASSITGEDGRRIQGLIVQTRVNASDVAGLASVFSPAWFRGVAGRLITATSESSRDSIPIPRANPLPQSFYIGGIGGAAAKAGEAVLQTLKLDA